MPGPINMYEKETANMNVIEKLNFYLEKKAYDAIAEVMIDAANRASMGDRDDLVNISTEFINGTLYKPLPPYEVEKEGKKVTVSNQIDPVKLEHIKAIYRKIGDRGRNTILEIHEHINECEEKIKNGQIKDTELVKDDAHIRRKLAHDIVMVRDPIAKVVNSVFNLSGAFQDGALRGYKKFDEKKNRNVDVKLFSGEKSVHDLLGDIDVEAVDSLKAEKNLTQEEYKKIFNEASDPNDSSNSTEFKVKIGEVKEGESLFSAIPKYITEIRSKKTEAQLEEFEDSLLAKKELNERFTRQVKSAVKVSRNLYDTFSSIEWANKSEDPTDSYHDVNSTLENFTHLGTDYRMKYDNWDPEMDRFDEKNYGVTADIVDTNVKNATHRMGRSIERLFDNTNSKYVDLEEAGKTDTPEYESAKKMLSSLQDVNFLKNTAQGIINEYDNARKEVGLIIRHDIDNRLKFINVARKQKGYTVLPEVQDDEYIRSLDQNLDSLMDSLADCGVSPEKQNNKYPELFLAVLEHKRIYKKYLGAEALGSKNAKFKYASALAKSTEKTKKLIEASRKFDKKYANEDGMTMGKADRRTVLNQLSTSINSKTVEVNGEFAPENYENYILRHSGELSGQKVGEKKGSIAKVMAAVALQKAGHKFDKKEIRKLAREMAEFYCIKKLPSYDTQQGGKKQLMNATKDYDSIVREVDRVREEMYGIKEGKFTEYVNEMKLLKESMWPSKGRSEEYKDLCTAIETASKMEETTRGMTEEQKAHKFAVSSILVVHAVQRYVKGKEKVRISDKGNDAFGNSMDALAIVSKYTKVPGKAMNTSVAKVLDKINEVRNDSWLTQYDRFEKRFGSKRANDRYLKDIKPKLDAEKAKEARKNAKKTAKKSTNRNTNHSM